MPPAPAARSPRTEVGAPALEALASRVTRCRKCPRLVAHRESVAATRRRAFLDWDYWGRPVPGFGRTEARLLIVGLAPAAHGGNRTGRMFTGDRSGDWLYRTLHRFGFASQAGSTARDDGLELCDTYITAAARCAPPDNKPTPAELATCRPYLIEEITLLPTRVVIALGKIAFESYLRARKELGRPAPEKPRFAHLAEYRLPDITLIGSYHPSQQNTLTGRLTQEMFDAVFARAREVLDAA